MDAFVAAVVAVVVFAAVEQKGNLMLHENKLNQFLKQIKKMPNPEAVVLSLMRGFVICGELPLITLPIERRSA